MRVCVCVCVYVYEGKELLKDGDSEFIAQHTTHTHTQHASLGSRRLNKAERGKDKHRQMHTHTQAHIHKKDKMEGRRRRGGQQQQQQQRYQ